MAENSSKSAKKYKKNEVELLKALSQGVLKSLATTCRKEGITSFKGFGVELSLDLDKPLSPYLQKKKTTETVDEAILTDSILSEEAALYWSSAGVATEQAVQ